MREGLKEVTWGWLSLLNILLGLIYNIVIEKVISNHYSKTFMYINYQQ